MDKLDAAQSSEAGMLIRRAIDLRAALKLGVRVGLHEIGADEFLALQILNEATGRLEEMGGVI
ncbi:MAG TPA: hypothetical protein PKJ41_09770 [Bryobacteraceae bacterium]|nr:hypothetical protein [Bryobacteraceae bacterium]